MRNENPSYYLVDFFKQNKECDGDTLNNVIENI